MKQENQIAFLKKYTVLSLLGYRSGADAPQRRKRQDLLRKVYCTDLAEELTPEQFDEADAGSWGEPKSEERLHAMVQCLRGMTDWWHLYDRRPLDDATRHRQEDALWLRERYGPKDDGEGSSDA